MKTEPELRARGNLQEIWAAATSGGHATSTPVVTFYAIRFRYVPGKMEL
jgi:hypothetical protein